MNRMGTPRLSPDRRRLSAFLKDLRARARLSGEQLGATLGWSQSKVSKIENGRTKPSSADIEAWAEATGATAAQRAELLELAETVADEVRSWSTAHAAGIAQRQREVADVE